MRLLRVHVIKADTCGGLLDGLNVRLRQSTDTNSGFDPLCLVGPNGAGKSQFLQVIAEIFQTVYHTLAANEERLDGNPSIEFEIEYLIHPTRTAKMSHVRVSRRKMGKKRGAVVIEQLTDGKWQICDLNHEQTAKLLPTKVVGYTSGDNETLSLPFLLSRSGYADEVARQAFHKLAATAQLRDTRLMLIDYGTHLEVLVANLLLGSTEQCRGILDHARLTSIHSFRCIVQLAHSAAPKISARQSKESTRKGIQLTDELESIIEHLKRCSTCWNYEEKDERYTFDFFIDEQTTVGVGAFWSNSFNLYSSLHKLAMLNDLAIPRATRNRFKKDTEARRFASRLPEPQDEDKVFRFERVKFRAATSNQIVDYVSLSDGEHQMAQLLGTFCMISLPGVLFLLDEPESHFNPLWRVKFISKLMDLPTPFGTRREESNASLQDGLMTTHAPFVPSDMARDRVLIFGKDAETARVNVRLPEIETFGTTFDVILDECFGVRPPISQESRDEIEQASQSGDPEQIRTAMAKLGYSVEKAFLADRLSELEKQKGGE